MSAWVIHVIRAIPACPVCPKSGHSANARVYEYTAYDAAENKSLEIKTLRQRRGRAVRTARSWRGIVPITHLAREGRMTVTIARRELLVALGGAAAAWPLGARAQQPDGMRRIGVLMGLAEDDPEIKARFAAFRQGLEKRGWSEGRNVR